MPTTAEEHISAHRAAGRFIDAGGVATFVRETGDGEPVLCMHGVPASSFLYRKVLPALAERGLRGISYDIPGLGLTARDAGVGATWTALGRHGVQVVEALGLERFHLVIHDMGGPVGMEIAASLPDRIASLTVMNTTTEVATFRKPWTMRPLEIPVLGELWLAMTIDRAFVKMMYDETVANRDAVSPAELLAYRRLLMREDRGRAFLKIMRNFETTPDKQRLYEGVVGSDRYPVQAVWGELDQAVRVDDHGGPVARLIGAENFHRVPGKHFLQEDCFEQIADHVAAIAAQAA